MMKIIILIALFFPAIASAHVMLDHASPAVGSTLKEAPKEVKLYFDGTVGVDKSDIDITDAEGKSVIAGELRGDDKDKTVLIIPIKAAHGKLTVKWEAYCPDCHQITRGSFTFKVD